MFSACSPLPILIAERTENGLGDLSFVIFCNVAVPNGIYVQMSPNEPKDDLDSLHDETKSSIKKARDLLDDFKIVQEHEGRILGEDHDL
jgi:hypothetical protein